jgi:hypothetical protein
MAADLLMQPMTKLDNSNREDRTETGRRRRRARVGGGLVGVLVIGIAALLLTGGSDETAAVDPAIAAQQNYHQAQYAAGVSSGWPQDASDRRVGHYLESAWHDPASSATTFVIDSRSSEDAGSPIAAAELARVQTRELPGYRERGLKRIRLAGRPAVRWAFDVGGEARLEYFFEECGVSFVVRGSTPPVAWEALSGFFRGMATVITANCED